ncbi:DMT family transporter [Aquabacterium sp. J223]|uniref:DMT family transporter n=1 Tax=Aquabacterium sp. J223 TaxID=2898431 RepID=UPI0021AE19AE|nr:DMT family transporter [Aquabacterium sp. J223]UUX97156.1 DMT family transporter [Aquabacterium sp. J223]
MKRVDVIELLALASLWGGSFLFTRIAVPEFGPLPLATLRIVGGALCLLPLLLWQGQAPALLTHWRALLAVGFFNSALPFTLFNVAALSLPAGMLGVFNATTPLWGALIAWAWLGERPGGWKALGLAIGFAGAAGLALTKAGAGGGQAGPWAVLACLAATAAYGLAASMTRRWTNSVPVIVLATGSLLASAIVLAPAAALTWPARLPGALAWGSVAALALLSTGVAYVLYFRLLARSGPATALSVTYLVPVFATLWGGLLLDEPVTAAMLTGGAVILAGTALVTGLVVPGRRRAKAA